MSNQIFSKSLLIVIITISSLTNIFADYTVLPQGEYGIKYKMEVHEYVDPKILGQRFYSRDDPKTEISEDWQLMHKVCNVLGLQHGIHYSEAIFTMGNDIWNAKKRPAVAPGNLPGEIMVLTDIRFDQQENKLLLSYYEYTVDDYWKTDVRLVNKLGCAVSKKIITTN